MSITFNVTSLIVSDMARSLAFYRRLGLDIPVSADAEPHVEVVLPGGLRLLFDTEGTVRSFDPGWTPATGGQGRIGLAFACGSPAEVDTVHDELVAAGHDSHRAPWDAFWGQRYASVADPDGNSIDLYAPLPAAVPSAP
ncbi:Glyoxalase [Frankia sp. AiPs1]|uniref:VOC family protein n=1 Tax=Frankia sp. AiPa1 TaxID=573492 RepID=UPI00202B5194|nr:VOC family protein [Frankia sp. AiPa1]MCL9758475.1 VOC family protein [Frankia sp. AiPa1]